MVIFNPDKIITDSRITHVLNGNRPMMDDYNMRCTSGHKWLFSITMGLLFFILSNSLIFYGLVYLVNKMTSREKINIIILPGLIYNLLLTIIFVLIVRLILW